MATYSSKLFTSVENMSKTIEGKLKEVSDKSSTVGEKYSAPVKGRIEELQVSLKDATSDVRTALTGKAEAKPAARKTSKKAPAGKAAA